MQSAKEEIGTMANNDPRAATTAHTQHVSVRRGTFELRGVHELRCAGAVERALSEQPHITEVRLDWKNDVVHVHYDPSRIGPADIEQVITRTGCDCVPVGVEDEQHEALAPPQRRMQHVMPATHADHGDHMVHDMSDPNMAATMERDMRNRFFVALLLTIPTVLY